MGNATQYAAKELALVNIDGEELQTVVEEAKDA